MSALELVKQDCLTKLTLAERAALRHWLAQEDDEWDRQMAADAESGKLDALFQEADRDFEAGRCKEI